MSYSRLLEYKDEEYRKELLTELQTGRGEQKDWREEQRDWKMTEEQLKCFESLRTTTYERNKEKNKDPVEGTCKWFSEHPKYLQWLKKKTSTWLWVTADPGCGKSVLSKSLVNYYESNRLAGRQNVCYFFFKDDSEENKSATHALCALLHQLFSQNTVLLKHALPSFQKNGSKLPQLFDTLWEIFAKAAADSDANSIVCVLDALDECAELSRLPLITKLAEFYSNPNINTRLKFLITSRPNTTIQNEITRRSRLDLESIQLVGENETEMKAIATEINLVIRARVEEFRLLRSRRKIHDHAHIAVQKQLDNIDNRTYLWVALIFPELEDNTGLAERKLLNIIKIIPNTVDEAYEKILAKSSNTAQAKKLLHIVVAAVRPLTVAEINVALSIQDGNKSLEDCDLEPEPSFRVTVRKLCGLFVIIQDSKVYLIHQTAKEFLIFEETNSQVTNKLDSGLSIWKHALKLRESNLVLAKSCIQYLLFVIFESYPLVVPREAFYEIEEKIVRYTHEHNFLDYTAKHWVTHFQGSQFKEYNTFTKSVIYLYNTQSKRFQTWFLLYWSTINSFFYPPIFTDLIIASYFGLELVTKLLLERKACNTDSKDQNNRIPLWWAADRGHEGIVKLLLERKEVDPDSKGEYGRTPLGMAAEEGHEGIVKLLLEQKEVDPDSKDEYDQTPLGIAAGRGYEGIVKLLSERL